MGWRKAFDITVSTRWHWSVFYFGLGTILGGLFLGLLTMLVYVAFFTVIVKTFEALCMNKYGSGYCGNLVARTDNFCSRCGSKAPWRDNKHEEGDDSSQPPN